VQTCRARNGERPRQVGIDDLAPALIAQVLQVGEPRDASGVHRHIQATQFIYGGTDGTRRRPWIRNIGDEPAGTIPEVGNNPL
jgi:hypothetical protein